MFWHCSVIIDQFLRFFSSYFWLLLKCLVAPPKHQLQHEVAQCRQQLLVHRRQEKQVSQRLNSIWCELTQIDALLSTGSVLLAILTAGCELLLPSNLVKVIEEEIKLFEDILDEQLDISYPDERVRA